ncbi:hypothetical protein FC26_GL001158 [Paucilactobacillus vaccinostercus DSM 20634]|uniref:Uncharacterized protein n=1 Tax=Paucilactobacillus vaccinostercus DSM 20634 TaxID=1423813 RepID=A0A0R2ACC4_9LACO|nr:hypothetical protein FC26_GL001158 [Paucilactobacillus vaccinostercus DSM 20634]
MAPLLNFAKRWHHFFKTPKPRHVSIYRAKKVDFRLVPNLIGTNPTGNGTSF